MQRKIYKHEEIVAKRRNRPFSHFFGRTDPVVCVDERSVAVEPRPTMI